MPGKAGAMRFYRAIFPTGMGQSANNLLQVIYFTLLKAVFDHSITMTQPFFLLHVVNKPVRS
jgi:hypothetical protein